MARNGAVTLDANNISTTCATLFGSISGAKFDDLNGDGIRQAGEPRLAGVTVFLDANNDGVLNAGEVSATTAAGGTYSFENLAPGTYRVREARRAGLLQTTPNPAAIALVGGDHVAGVDFGDFRLASISGTKYDDANGNGVRDAGDRARPA